MKRTLQAFTIATCLFTQTCFSQDKDAKSDLIAGLTKLAQRDVSLVGAVEEQSPGGPALPGGLQQVVVIGKANRTDHYQGDIEVLTTTGGDFVLVSKDDLPGIKIFKHDEDTVFVQSHTEEPFSLGQLSKNISHLANWKALSAAVKESSEFQSTGKGKVTEVRVVIAKDFIPADSMPAIPAIPGMAGGVAGNNVAIRIAGGPIQPSITELAVTFSLSQTKEIVGLTYELQYDEPMAKFMKVGAVAMVQIDGTVKAPTLIEKDDVTGDDAENNAALGEKVIYDFDVVSTPSKKAAEFPEQAKAMLKSRK